MFSSRSNLQIIYTFNVKVQIFGNRSIFPTKQSVQSPKAPFYGPITFFFGITEEIFSSTP
jgi:hypothetical protein